MLISAMVPYYYCSVDKVDICWPLIGHPSAHTPTLDLSNK